MGGTRVVERELVARVFAPMDEPVPSIGLWGVLPSPLSRDVSARVQEGFETS